MSVDAILRSRQWRNEPAPVPSAEDIPSANNRWARRRFDPTKPKGLSLPWIAMNPAGNEHGRGRTGKRIFEWSWHWGFDDCIVYNVRPFSEPNSEVAKRSFGGRDEEISDSHLFIADQLRDVDAVMVAWGDEQGEQKGWARQLLARINAEREIPIATWCLSTNKSGHPKHPGARASVPLTKQPEEWVSIFDRDQPSRTSQKRGKTTIIPEGQSKRNSGQTASLLQAARPVPALFPSGKNAPPAFNASAANKLVWREMHAIEAMSDLNVHISQKQSRLDNGPKLANTTRVFRHEFTNAEADILVREDVFLFDPTLRDLAPWTTHSNPIFQNIKTANLSLLHRTFAAVKAFAAARKP
ncbi:MAG: DUF1643 domain-containing protein [Mesorhizobium sp.]|nr:DUF1643 domain-containing protein [Mesorhizobium sp.]